MSQPQAQGQIQPVPQIQVHQPQPQVTTAPTSTTPPAPAAQAHFQPQAAPAPTAPIAAANLNPAAASTSPPQTFTRQLDAGEEFWVWKLGLRAFLVIVAIIGIGCMGRAFSTAAAGPYSYELDDHWSIVWTLITFGISALWCSVCILVLLIRKRPCHPGVAVGIDLILWLAFIPTAMFALIGALSVVNFGSDGTIGQYSSYGNYNLASNGTWVWNATEYDSYYQRDRDCSVDGRYSNNYNNYGYDTCEEEDAYVNALMAARPYRARVEITGTVCQFLGLFIHLALFIWACVDTHRRNRRKVSKDAERLAGDIVMNMVKSGAIVPAQGQRQGPYQQLPDGYQQQRGMPYGGGWGPAPMGRGPPPMMHQPMMPMQPHQAFMPPGPEKGESARFA